MLLLIILGLCLTSRLAGSCSLSLNAAYPGVFTRPFGSNTLILSVVDGRVIWDDNLVITGYCSTGFKSYSSFETTPHTQLFYSCSGTTLMYKKTSTGAYQTAINNGALTCGSATSFYEATMDTCQDYGLGYGFFINNQPIVLADACFNLNTMRARYVHYVAGPRPSTIQGQSSYNPVNITLNNQAPVDVLFDNSSIKLEKDALSRAILSAMPAYSAFIFYDMLDLVPLKSSLGLFSAYANEFNQINVVPWWTPLKYGNWKGVENAIDSLSAYTNYDVYAGTSGVVTYPLGGKFLYTDRLTYKVNQYVRNVPLYVWNYVKPKSGTDEGVVIVGVNSPFFDNENSTQVFCKDICDTYDWLDGISRLRKTPTLGYVFCCSPKEAVGKLENLPPL